MFGQFVVHQILRLKDCPYLITSELSGYLVFHVSSHLVV